MASAQATIVEDLKDERVPSALYWTTEHVAEWIEELGFPQYKVTFYMTVQVLGIMGNSSSDCRVELCWAMFYFLAFNSGNAFRCLCALIQVRYRSIWL